jgi:DNA mismatch endonuclease (patch repair protein)
MSRVRSSDTRPELEVRRLVHRLGYRFRLHRRTLPGTPDLVFPSLRAVIFVHGCFWHRHAGCSKTSTPTTRPDFWAEKFETNQRRDEKVRQALLNDGWNVDVIWECEVLDKSALSRRLTAFLQPLKATDKIRKDASTRYSVRVPGLQPGVVLSLPRRSR